MIGTKVDGGGKVYSPKEPDLKQQELSTYQITTQDVSPENRFESIISDINQAPNGYFTGTQINDALKFLHEN